jgi:ribose 5-phosphate isomerase A
MAHPIQKSQELAKEAAAAEAVSLIEDGMVVGLGTGSTSEKFIAHLGAACRRGLSIQAVATSIHIAELAKKLHIPLIDLNEVEVLDVDVDGADEVDEKKRMIKGGGGALLREKIVASSSREMIVIIDSTKLVSALGQCPLPVEVESFGYLSTLRKIAQQGFHPVVRMRNGKPFTTDNGHFILDLHLKKPLSDPEHVNALLHQIPGVVETGLFLNLAGRVIVGYPDGRTEVR